MAYAYLCSHDPGLSSCSNIAALDLLLLGRLTMASSESEVISNTDHGQ